LTNHKEVIILPSAHPPPPWSFFDFGYSRESNPIEDWYQGQLSDRGRLTFDALLKDNQKIANPQNWQMSKKHMQGILKGHQIWQWTIRAEIPYRLLGIFGTGVKRAIFLMGYYHKGDSYTPPDALQTALNRKKLYEKGACVLHERPVDTNQ
jgi:hypothetical protein